MEDRARVAVIGGGILGCSAAYHLTRLGWSDVLLVEKGELTSGSTWHAAGNVPFYAVDPFFARLQKESFETYERLEREGKTPVGLHSCGSLRIAHTTDEILEYRRFIGFARALDIECDLIGPEEARALFPLLERRDFLGALHIPRDGYTDPAQTTHALASAARKAGARIRRQTRVEAISRTRSGEWRLETADGTITAEFVVNCGGIWAPEISAMVGGRLPVVPMEHEYLVTEPIPQLAGRTRELPIIRDFSVPYYVRQEQSGLIVSCYEDRAVFWGLDGIPRHFDRELLPPDLDRAAPQLEATTRDIPAVGRAGVRRVVNGPTPRSADLTALVGPAHGYRSFFVLCGVSGGFLHSSLSYHLAEWIVEGSPSEDLSRVDVRRFGDYATRHYTVTRVAAGHAYAAAVCYPHAEPSAGRPARTSAIYDRLKGRGAAFGVRNGWEVPNWFAPAGVEARDRPAYRRANWFASVGQEVHALERAVGVADLSSLAKFEVGGPDAAALLARLDTGGPPGRDGEVRACPLLDARGRMIAPLLSARLGTNRFYLTGDATVEQRAEDWLRWRAEDLAVQIENVTDARGVLLLVGPEAAAVIGALAGATREADDGEAGMTARYIDMRFGRPLVMRVVRAGVAGFELHHPMAAQIPLYEAVLEAGAGHAIVDVGMRALESLRLEQGEPLPLGRGNHLKLAAAPPARADGPQLAWLLLEARPGPEASDPWGGEAVHRNGRLVGLTCSGGFGYRIGRGIAAAWVETDCAEPGTPLEVELLGERIPAVVVRVPIDKRGQT